MTNTSISSSLKQPVLVTLCALITIFFAFYIILPFTDALRFTIVAPFLFYIPGFFVTRVIFPKEHGVKRSIFALLLSTALLYLSIHIVEQQIPKMTPTSVAWSLTPYVLTTIIGTLNLLCAILWIVTRKRRIQF